MEKAVDFFVKYKEKERMHALTQEEKGDLGLLLLMQQANEGRVNRSEVMKALED